MLYYPMNLYKGAFNVLHIVIYNKNLSYTAYLTSKAAWEFIKDQDDMKITILPLQELK